MQTVGRLHTIYTWLAAAYSCFLAMLTEGLATTHSAAPRAMTAALSCFQALLQSHGASSVQNSALAASDTMPPLRSTLAVDPKNNAILKGSTIQADKLRGTKQHCMHCIDKSQALTIASFPSQHDQLRLLAGPVLHSPCTPVNVCTGQVIPADVSAFQKRR